MLQLKNIVKVYGENETAVKALKGVSVNFRESEFVSILGPSGCGKTTLLNIVGGLDRYTSGDLVINETSTKNYKDGDWDTYRNHSVGFVFQSYNLIPHQSVLKNVELALTLSGVSRTERRERAAAALKEVGLGDQLHKRPNQLSGGQMQRVAIARAIVNNPDIILADEPTGALDSETSVQVMEILKELSKTRLVVMVTHNGELAEEYSTRIIRLHDGLIIGDTNEFTDEEAAKITKKAEAKKDKKPSMSLLTALSLSLNNLFTKRGRTILTSLAGSIGIIGIALILSVSTGFNSYVSNVQRDTLSSDPITVSTANVDMTSVAISLMGNFQSEGEKYPDTTKATSQNVISQMLSSVAGSMATNDLSGFKKWLDSDETKQKYKDVVATVKYAYNLSYKIYSENNDFARLYPMVRPEFSEIVPDNWQSIVTGVAGENTQITAAISSVYTSFVNFLASNSAFCEMTNVDLVKDQYEIISGSWPTNSNQAIIVVSPYNQISDVNLYQLGFMGLNDIRWIFLKTIYSYLYSGTKTEAELDVLVKGYIDEYSKTHPDWGIRSDSFYNGVSFEDLLDQSYRVLTAPDFYKVAGYHDANHPESAYYKQRTNDEIKQGLVGGDGVSLDVVGVVRLKEGVTAGCLSGALAYLPSLTQSMISSIQESDVVKAYNREYGVNGESADNSYTSYLRQKGSILSDDYFNILYDPESPETLTYRFDQISMNVGGKIGVVNTDIPSRIEIYPVSFEQREDVIAMINDYNRSVPDDQRINYSDYVGLVMSSVTDIINAVTYVLIAFVSISLIVSSIMIGIITYISVLERTKEIGVLRAMGASKRDISRVFNAETAVIGTVSGILGILITLLLNIPINIIIKSLSGLANVALLPAGGAITLIIISIVLTIISGLIPARMASKKDPVVALRSE